MQTTTIEETYAQYLHDTLPFLTFEQCALLVDTLKPDTKEIGTQNGQTFFEVTMSKAANAIGAMMSGDQNAHHHTTDGIMQTVSLVGMCAAVTSRFRPSYQLMKITPDVSFKTQVPVGKPVIMGIQTLMGRARNQKLQLDGWIDDVSIFRQPRELLLCKI